VGAVGRQEQEPTTVSSQDLGGARALVCGKGVENDNGAGVERGRELGFNIGVECRAVHRTSDNPRRNQRVLCQPGDERLCSPFAEGCGAVKSRAHRGTSPKTGQVRFDGGLVHWLAGYCGAMSREAMKTRL